MPGYDRRSPVGGDQRIFLSMSAVAGAIGSMVTGAVVTAGGSGMGADAARRLASDGASYMTGRNLRVHGGLTRSV